MLPRLRISAIRPHGRVVEGGAGVRDRSKTPYVYNKQHGQDPLLVERTSVPRIHISTSYEVFDGSWSAVERRRRRRSDGQLMV